MSRHVYRFIKILKYFRYFMQYYPSCLIYFKRLFVVVVLINLELTYLTYALLDWIII